MAEYNNVNVKLTDTQLKKLKTAVKKKNKNYENEFKNIWQKWSTSLIITDKKTKTKLRNAFNNNMSADINFSKAQISTSAIDAGIQKNIHGSGTTTLKISNEEMNDIIIIIQALEDSNLLLKGVTKTIKNETKE